MDSHTVAKYWREGGIKKVERKPRKSILDKYSDEITRLFEKPGVHKRAAYEYLLDKYGEDNIGTYYKSQDNLTNLLQLSVLSFFRI